MTSRPADPPVSPRRARAVPVRLLLALTLCGLAGGLALSLAGQPRLAVLAWTACVLPVLAALLVEIARSLRRGEVGLDIVAALSMSAALFIGETLAAAVVALMYAGGSALESFAEGRARREMHALLARVPRTATRVRGEALEEVPLAEIRPGDLLLIRQGDIVPVDGTLESEQALLDPSALTGESLPVRLESGQEMMSGAANAGELFTLRARREAADSTYAGIVRLVEAAQRDKAPMSRLADRYALVFLAVTLLMAMAAWGFSGDPVRAVAVLVVATPCPLILAVPVALVAGLSRAAHYGVLIKGGRALETLGRARTLILDKTGTLTDGRPQLIAVHPCGAMSPAALLASAAALEQASKHPMARALVAAAQAGGAVLPVPDQVVETPGEGIAGLIDGQRVVVGETAFVRAHCPASTTPPAAREAGQAVVALAIEGELMGTFVLADALRPGIPGLLADLRRAGLERLLLATGDRRAVAESVTAGLPLDAIHSGLTPAAKVEVVRAERRNGPVAMVGDGVNDAPALAAADLGIAMGARGAAASAEAADIVLLVDRLDPLLAGLDIAQGARRIALQSVVAGIGLSVAGMVAAACGWLTPVEGALLQEAIDVAVILNALRTLRLSPRRAANP